MWLTASVARSRTALCLFAAAALAGIVAARADNLPPDFVRLADIAPAIRQDIRYAGDNNFTGLPVPGYGAAQCWLRREAAQALALVQARAQAGGLGLIVYDCYRPQRATQAFMAWAGDPGTLSMKARFYPDVDKAQLFLLGYIGRNSSHSLGNSVDVALVRSDGTPLDFGSPFDLFAPVSATGAAAIPAPAKAARANLVRRMQAAGFENYAREWWHFQLRGAAAPAPLDVEIR